MSPRTVGRYTLHDEIASGGMATVHLGRLAGPGGFAQKLAIKRLHALYARDPEFVSMFLDEARIASHVHHSNVIRVFDVLFDEGELFLVMEYVRGETLARLLALSKARGEAPSSAIALGIAIGALAGLHAAHEATDDAGRPLGIVHRDVSPQNVLVGLDGAARILDFGIAKAVSKLHTTRRGQVKGKLGYMAPEQRLERPVDRRADVYAMGVVVWEMLTRQRFARSEKGEVAEVQVSPPSALVPGIPAAIDAAVMKAVAREPSARFATARDFAVALEAAGGVASALAVAAWVERLAGEVVSLRDRAFSSLERADEVTAVTMGPQAAPNPGRASGAPITMGPQAAPDARRAAPEPLALHHEDELRPPVSSRRARWLPRAALIALALALVVAAALWFARPWARPRSPLFRHPERALSYRDRGCVPA